LAEEIKKVEYYYAIIIDGLGEARRLLKFCLDNGVNLINFTAFPLGEGEVQMDFFPEDSKKLEIAAQEAGIPLRGPKRAFLIRGEDRMGVLLEHHVKLSDGGVNIIAANGTADGRGGFGHIIWVDENDYERAAELLGV